MVTSDAPACREIVEQGVTGWLVPARDADALADVLQQAIERPDLRERYGSAARGRIATDFSTDRVISEVFAIYEDLTSVAPSGAGA
jgi:glycosyltransferase involved in cell wall biosynthesis